MNYTTILINTIIHILLVLIFEGVFLFVILYPILTSKVLSITNNLTWNLFAKIIWPTINWSNCDTTNPNDLTPYYITKDEYKLIQLTQSEELNYIDSHYNYPYIIYIILLSFLIILVIILIFVASYMNIYVNYRYIMINSFIIFLLICAVAGSILWLDVFSQNYQINIAKPFLEKFLEEYKSL